MIHTDGIPTIANARSIADEQDASLGHSVRVDRRKGDRRGFHQKVAEAVFSEADIERSLEYGARRALELVQDALAKKVIAGEITTPEECIAVIALVRESLS